MEFRKMVTITLYTRQQKRHWCIEQSFGLCGRGRGWEDLGECHWNMYNIMYETSHQSRFDAWYWMLGTDALGSNTLATWCEELTHLKRPWCWERLRAGEEGDDRGWDDWMALPIRWTWICCCPWIPKSSTGLSNWTELNYLFRDSFPKAYAM